MQIKHAAVSNSALVKGHLVWKERNATARQVVIGGFEIQVIAKKAMHVRNVLTICRTGKLWCSAWGLKIAIRIIDTLHIIKL